MKNKSTPCRFSDFFGNAFILGAVAVAVLCGCTVNSPPRSTRSLAEPDQEAMRRLRETAADESMKLLINQQAIQQQMRRQPPPPEIRPAAPKFDPLEGKIVTLSMSKASISQILNAIADSGKVNLVVDPAVLKTGLVSDMYLRGVSLREAFNEVLRAYDVSGEINGNTMRVTLQEERLISLDFLNASTTLDMSSGGNVFGGGSNATNALRGNLALSGTGGVKSDPYAEIENGVKAILGENQSRTAPAQTTSLAASGVPAAATSNAAGLAIPSGGRNELADTERSDSQFSINKMTGTLYLKARPSKVRSVEKLMARVQGMLRKQVYIEAQLIDVQLSDNFEFGVDWSLLKGRLSANFGAIPAVMGGVAGVASGVISGRSITLPAQSVGSPTGQSLGVGYLGSSLGMVVNALRSFGNLRVLSNPNVQVRNGTPALLSVGTSSRYVSRSTSTQSTPGGGANTTTSDVQTDSVFSGVMVGVLPFMRDDGRIELLINPMQSDVDAKSLQLVNVNETNRITLPVVSYKGLTTTLNLGDGDIVVIGGLIDQRTSSNDRGAPGISDLPGIGKLFGNNTDAHSSRELVVVLRVTVL